MRFVKNEWIKIWSQKNAWMMLALTVIGVMALLGLNKYLMDDTSTKEARLAANEEKMANYELLIKEETEPENILYYEDELKMTQYRIDKDLVPADAMLMVDGISSSLTFLLVFVGIFTMVIAASIVSNEFGTGTIKMLLTRPVARWKILLSKLVATLLFGVALFIAGIAVATLLSAILFETRDPLQLSIVNGQVIETVVEMNIGKTILLNGVSIVMTMLFAFMLSTLFGSSTLSVSLALGILFMGSLVIGALAEYEFTKYIWFANDLAQFDTGSSPIIPDLTFGFAVTVNIVYATIFLATSFIYFMRRDVTA